MWRELRPSDEGYTYYSYRFNCKAKNLGWRLDYFVVSKAFAPHVEKIVRRPELHGCSDHVPLAIVLDLPKFKPAAAGGAADVAGVLVKQRSIKDMFHKATK